MCTLSTKIFCQIVYEKRRTYNYGGYDAGDFLLEGQSNTVSGVAFKIQLKA